MAAEGAACTDAPVLLGYVLQGICMAVLQGGLLNLASLFPPIYIQVRKSLRTLHAQLCLVCLCLCFV